MIYTTTDPMSGRVSLKLQRSRSMLLTAIFFFYCPHCHLEFVLAVGLWARGLMGCEHDAACVSFPARLLC